MEYIRDAETIGILLRMEIGFYLWWFRLWLGMEDVSVYCVVV